MAGSDDNLPVLGDWPPTTPRTQAFLSSFLGEDLLPGNGNEVPLPEKQNPCLDSMEDKVGREDSGVSITESNGLSIPKPGLRGGLTERIAARAGFNAPKLITSQIRSTSLGSSSPDVQSHHHIPFSPGFSPSAFLDSPVFLFNSLAQSSPTTGKFPLGEYNNTSSLPISGLADKNKDTPFANADVKPFAFKPHIESNSSYLSSTANKTDLTLVQQQPLPSTEASVQPEFSNQAGSIDIHPGNQQEDHPLSGFPEPADKNDSSVDFTFEQKLSDSAIANENSPPPVDQLEGDDQKGEFSSVALGQPSEDGYNWRKYGQKQVKGSEFPRSYYKCTHPNCQVKKKVERSPEGQVTEIIYKGAHNHSQPPLNRRASVTSSNLFVDMQNDASEKHGASPSMDGRPTWASTLNGTANLEWRNDSVDASSSAPVSAEFCDPSMSMSTQDVPRFESSDAVDISLTLSNDEEEDDGTTHGNGSLSVDGEDEESELKRRKLEASVIDMSAASRAVREPRVVVQTTSEVDILDDGYRWRKYGQKVVKGNPNPRSYYKCTSVGCTVRKHVERASHDLKSVITTYEGKHNHEVPAARNSSHSNSGPSGSATSIASQSHNIHRRSEPSHVQENFPRFDTQAALGSFNMPPGREQLGPPAGFSFGLNQSSLTSLAMAGMVTAGPLPQLHAYLGQQPMNEPGYVIPKGEPMDEPMTESSLPIPNEGSVYQQMMGRLPLGP